MRLLDTPSGFDSATLSRSGITMGGGLLAGLSNEDAARYSFLLATPIIGAAALLKLPDLLGADAANVRGPALVGALGAAVTTVIAVKFLLRYFETNRLTPFGISCIAAGTTCTLIFAL
jgi:undecaprenyl-diphosphatase